MKYLWPFFVLALSYICLWSAAESVSYMANGDWLRGLLAAAMSSACFGCLVYFLIS